MGSGGGHSTNFSSHTLESLKAMVRDAQPDKVDEIADHWMYVHDQLAGDAPDGSIKDLLDKAVADVREYWHGAAAEAFERHAKTLSASLANGSLYAKNTAHTLKAAAIDLRDAQRTVTALQDSEGASKSGDLLQAIGSKVQDGADWLSDFGSRSDDTLKHDLANGMNSGDALDKHRGTLSRGREIALQAAAHMEKLGASYNVKSNQLAPPPPRDSEKPISPPDSTVPPPDVGVAVVPAVASPRRGTGTAARASSRSASGSMPPAGGVASPQRSQEGGGTGSSARSGTRPPMPQAPRPGTALDGVRGGVANPVGPPGTGPGAPVVGAPDNSGSGIGGPSIPGGGPVMGGRGPAGGRTVRPGSPGVPSKPPGGRTTAGKTAVPGAPGQPGQAGRPPIAGGTGPGGSGKGAARGRQGGVARRPGGVVGEPNKPGVPGRGSQGGSGLHRSRGGALNGRSEGSSRSRGPLGVPASGQSASKGKERRKSERPDYLVEDEETWVSQRDVVPGVVGVPASEEAEDGAIPEERSRALEPDSSEGNSKA